MNTAQDKRIDFLWIVQMIMQKHAENILGWSGIAGDAVAASYYVPKTITARDAALAFCAVYIDGFNGEEKAEVPSWMIALADPL